MPTPTEAIAIAPAISSTQEISSSPASSSAQSGFSAPARLSGQTGLSTQRHLSLRESPNPSSRTLDPTQHDSHWLPRAIPERLNTCNKTHSSLGQAICAAPAHPRTVSLYSSSVHNNVAELICETTHRTLPTQLDHTITYTPEYT